MAKPIKDNIKDAEKRAIKEGGDGVLSTIPVVLPALAQAHGNYCTTLARESRLEESVDCYREAIRIFPNQVDAYFNLGVTYARLERWQEAIDVWTRVLDLRPGYTAAELNIQKVQGLLAGKPEATP